MLDPLFIDRETQALMRESGEYVEIGWYAADDNFRPQLGPFQTREECQKACDEANAED